MLSQNSQNMANPSLCSLVVRKLAIDMQVGKRANNYSIFDHLIGWLPTEAIIISALRVLIGGLLDFFPEKWQVINQNEWYR